MKLLSIYKRTQKFHDTVSVVSQLPQTDVFVLARRLSFTSLLIKELQVTERKNEVERIKQGLVPVSIYHKWFKNCYNFALSNLQCDLHAKLIKLRDTATTLGSTDTGCGGG